MNVGGLIKNVQHLTFTFQRDYPVSLAAIVLDFYLLDLQMHSDDSIQQRCKKVQTMYKALELIAVYPESRHSPWNPQKSDVYNHNEKATTIQLRIRD